MGLQGGGVVASSQVHICQRYADQLGCACTGTPMLATGEVTATARGGGDRRHSGTERVRSIGHAGDLQHLLCGGALFLVAPLLAESDTRVQHPLGMARRSSTIPGHAQHRKCLLHQADHADDDEAGAALCKLQTRAAASDLLPGAFPFELPATLRVLAIAATW